MKTAARFTVVAAALLTLGAVACSSAPEPESEPVAADVKDGELTPTCIKGGITCGSFGGRLGGGTGFNTSGGPFLVQDPTPPPQPAKGYDPDNCGDMGCKWDAAHFGCDCSGVGYGLASTIGCPWAHPCARLVYGSYRCYDLQANGYCAP